jgi:hypothetical protein
MCHHILGLSVAISLTRVHRRSARSPALCVIAQPPRQQVAAVHWLFIAAARSRAGARKTHGFAVKTCRFATLPL